MMRPARAYLNRGSRQWQPGMGWWPIESTGTARVLNRTKSIIPNATVTGSVAPTVSTLFGSGLKATDTTLGAAYLSLGASDSFLPVSAVTIVIAYAKTDATLRASAAFGVENSGGLAGRCGGMIPYSDGTVYWDFGGATEGVTRLSVGGLTFAHDVWAFTVGPRGMEIWQNGIKRASNSATPTRAVTSAIFQVLGGNQEGADLAAVYDFRIYLTQLDSTLCQHLTDPRTRWDLYWTPSPTRYLYVSAAAPASRLSRLSLLGAG